MPHLNQLPNGTDETASLSPAAVAIKNTYYGLQELGDTEAYFRLQGILTLIDDAVVIADDNGDNMLKGAADFLTKWKSLLRPNLVEPYLDDPTVVDALEPDDGGAPASPTPGASTAAQQQAGVDFIRNTLPRLIRRGDSYDRVAHYMTAYLYYMLGKEFLDKLLG